MRMVWQVNPSTSFSLKGRGVFLVEFSDKKDLIRVRDEGPWLYRNDLVVVAQCKGVADLTVPIDFTEIWVQFHNAHADSLKEEGIRMITDSVGKPVSDPLWGVLNGKQFFKVKLQVNINKPIKDRVPFTHPIQGELVSYCVYEKLGRFCNFCGLVGHDLNSCPDRTHLARLKNSYSDQDRHELKDILKPSFGPWITSPTLVPIQQGNNEVPKAQNQTTESSAGLKRSLNEFFQHIDRTCETQQEQPQPILLPHSDTVFFISDNNGDLSTSSKRAKAARPQSPPGFL